MIPTDVFDALADELWTCRAELVEKLAAAKLAKMDSFIESKKIEAGLRDALTGLVQPQLIAGAIAMLRSDLADGLKLDERDKVIVTRPQALCRSTIALRSGPRAMKGLRSSGCPLPSSRPDFFRGSCATWRRTDD